MYEMRAGARAIVHLHSTHSVAVSCLAGIDAADVLPPLTAYYVMRVGRLPLIPYFPPGDEALAAAVRQVAAPARRGPARQSRPRGRGRQLDAAVGAVEELEATARLFLLLRGQAVRPLTRARGQPRSRPAFPGPDPCPPVDRRSPDKIV